MDKEPKIAILLSTYNGEDFLAEQLDSLLKQSYSNFIIIIRDDGSTDGTENIINHYVVKRIDKKAYLSSLAIADYIIVTCDSTSMISEAAVTGKPVYMAMMKPKKSIKRFNKFYSQFKTLGIAKELTDSIDNWSYDKLDEVNRIAPIIKEKMKKNGII